MSGNTHISQKSRIEIPSLDRILEEEQLASGAIAQANARMKAALEASQREAPALGEEGTVRARTLANEVAKEIKNQAKKDTAVIAAQQDILCAELRTRLETNFDLAVSCALKLVSDASGSAPC